MSADTLVFVDTNILLDFYRVRDAGLSLLAHITTNRDRMITGSQVEMEYQKNRQREVLKVLHNFKSPDWNSLSAPAFLATSQPQRAIASRRKEIDKHSKRLKGRIEGILKNPSRNDPVFKAATTLFRTEGPYNLSRNNPRRFHLRRLAWKRFILGYPPRKGGDTSTGDAINWEWIIDCAIESGKNVVIVSRDSDYGVQFGQESFLNDWLVQEFRQRVGARRKIGLTASLAEAFKQAKAPVTRQQAAEERVLLQELENQRAKIPVTNLGFGSYDPALFNWPNLSPSLFRNLLEGFEAGRVAAATAQDQGDKP